MSSQTSRARLPPPVRIQLPRDPLGLVSDTLTVGAEGVGYSALGGCFVAWTEVGQVSVEVSSFRSLFGLSSNASRLMFFPLDRTGFAARHPTIPQQPVAPHAPVGGWALWLGADRTRIGPVADAVAWFAGPRFVGVRNHGAQSLF